MSAPDNTLKKLKSQIQEWERVCPEEVTETKDVGEAESVTEDLLRELSKLVNATQSSQKSADQGAGDQREVSAQLEIVEQRKKELLKLKEDLKTLKKWLLKVRSSSDPVPFAMVAKGSRKGSLHVFKHENRVQRAARSGKQEMTGAKIFEGTCTYSGGKLRFKFEDGARAPWKALLQRMIKQANVNMKVMLDKEGGDDTQA